MTGATGDGQAGSAFPTPLAVKVSDAQGIPVPNALVRFTIPLGGGSLSASADTTDAQGTASVTWTLGESAGAARADARVAGVLVPAVFNATVKAGPASSMQRISNPPGQSAAGFELADSIDIRLTDRFGNPVAGTPVNFAVLNGGGSISPTAGTTNESGTARAAWKLGSAGSQRLRVSAGSIETTVDATAIPCTESQIAIGSVLTIGPNDSKCVVLSGTASRYFVTVVNAAPNAASTSAFRVRGAGAGTGTTSGDVVTTTAPSLALTSAAARAQLEEARERIEAHDLILRANERVMQQLMPQARSARAALRMQAMAPPVAPPNVGDTVSLRIPGVTNLCSLSGATNVRARVVFVGQHGVMLEDVAAPLAGQTDSLYQLVGAEFDSGMWTLLSTNFGNPLAMDAETDNNERFYMLFSKVVNDLQGGSIAGFVASSDFFPQDICPASNLAEVFYARVPTVEGPGNGSGTAGDWYRRTRTVMMHEVKHIVSFAERFSNDAFVPTSAF
ncbi:MAG TPA: Ig-like domain-containing protein, partial [Vicinamibacterales bacterium]|nr:Ig-like domain-containing protein [Vicinamibacterales bacterium]